MSDLFESAKSCKNKDINDENLLKCLTAFLYSLKYNKVFLNRLYVSCLPVFERIIMRLKNILPTEKHFAMYIGIHLTMLYYKSIKQSLKQKPDIFDDLKQNGKEALEIVGFIFGTYIGHEVKELVSGYFFSVIEIYKKVLRRYLHTYFARGDAAIVVFILKGLLNVGHVEAFLLVEYILRKKYLFSISQTQELEISKALKDCKIEEISLLVRGRISSQC